MGMTAVKTGNQRIRIQNLVKIKGRSPLFFCVQKGYCTNVGWVWMAPMGVPKVAEKQDAGVYIR